MAVVVGEFDLSNVKTLGDPGRQPRVAAGAPPHPRRSISPARRLRLGRSGYSRPPDGKKPQAERPLRWLTDLELATERDHAQASSDAATRRLDEQSLNRCGCAGFCAV
jgi:hypothetical protein